MIRVRLYNLLAERSLSGKGEYEIPFEDGLRPLDIMRREGFRGDEEESIVVLINEQQAGRRTLLSDGDRVEFMLNMAGGQAPGQIRPVSTSIGLVQTRRGGPGEGRLCLSGGAAGWLDDWWRCDEPSVGGHF